MRLLPEISARIAADRMMMEEFSALCDFGGRLAGTESERQAMAYVKQRGSLASGVPCTSLPVSYGGWRARKSELRLSDGAPVPCHPLVRSAPTVNRGLSAEVIDLGRGTPE